MNSRQALIFFLSLISVTRTYGAEDPIKVIVDAIEAAEIEEMDAEVYIDVTTGINVLEFEDAASTAYIKMDEDISDDQLMSIQQNSVQGLLEAIPDLLFEDGHATHHAERQASGTVTKGPTCNIWRQIGKPLVCTGPDCSMYAECSQDVQQRSHDSDESSDLSNEDLIVDQLMTPRSLQRRAESGDRSTEELAQDIVKTVPEHVKEDMLKNPEKAAESLNAEFSDNKHPNWYKVPRDVQEYFITPSRSDVTPPRTTETHGSGSTSKPQSDEGARRQSESASKMSVSAHHLASEASQQSSAARKASESIHSTNRAKNLAQPSFPDSKIAFGTSVGVAVTCLGLALIL